MGPGTLQIFGRCSHKVVPDGKKRSKLAEEQSDRQNINIHKNYYYKSMRKKNIKNKMKLDN